ncbi:MAG TPA: flagellar export protein FliJ, partial [Coprothermobacter proteolyticus]|nr:flagellar export protein FliJ [Coprothermobacter proteolyticus]
IEHSLEVTKKLEAQNRHALVALAKGGIDPFQIKAVLNYGAALNEDIEKTKEQLARHTVLVREAQEEAILRTREKKALEQLKEKHLSQYMDEYWWEQSKELDEIGSRYFKRNGKEVT